LQQLALVGPVAYLDLKTTRAKISLLIQELQNFGIEGGAAGK